MKVIKPKEITDDEFSSSTVAENDYSAWDSGTAYVVGDKVIRTSTHRIYECLVNNTNYVPEDNLTGATPKWLDYAPTNRWAMFDDVVGTVTTATSPLTVVINPGVTGAIGFLGLIGTQLDVTLKDSPGGTTVYEKTISLDGTIITSWYDWFFEDYTQLSDLVIADLPDSYADPELTISVTGSSQVGCGLVKCGKLYTIGNTQYGANVGITDYSRKEQDDFGNWTILQRSFNKNANIQIECDPSDLNKIYRLLSELRTIPVFWIGTTESGFEPLLIYGFYRDFSIDIAYYSMHYCTLEIEGLT